MNTDKPLVITYWDTSNLGNETAVYQDLVDGFEAENPHIRVNLVNVPFAEARNRLQLAMESGTAPDAFRSEVGWTASFARSGFLEPLDGTPAAADSALFRPTLLQQARFNGRLYGIPLATDTLALLYNKALFSRAGVTSAPKSWDALKGAAAAVKERTGSTGFSMKAADGYYAMPFLFGEGIDLVDVPGKHLTISSPQAVKAIEIYRSMFTSPGTAPADLADSSDVRMTEAFANGKVAAIIQGPWELTNIYRGTAFRDKANLGVAPVPAGSKSTGSPIGGHNISVYSGSPATRKQAAEKFASFLTSRTSQAMITERNSTLPTRSDVIVSGLKADPAVESFQDALAVARPRPELPEYSSLFPPLNSNLGKITQGSDIQGALNIVSADHAAILRGFTP
ncbi:extracellular solute-binding protein [Kitasatospora purpeofusca]|uniref:extracellular solute-binding protein n=1 Tax=Kitasatospora purpeofusca TaxID=67352 RepID=UPI0033E689ED